MMIAVLCTAFGPACTRPTAELNEDPPPLVRSESPDESSDVVYSVQRTLHDYADARTFDGQTIDTWTCHRNGRCSSVGVTDVSFDGERLQIEWQIEYDSDGNVLSNRQTTMQDGRPDETYLYEYSDGAVLISGTEVEGRLRVELPTDTHLCETRCRELVAAGNSEPDHCDVPYPIDLVRFDLTVRPIEHPTFGRVWEAKTRKPDDDGDRIRIVDANCQQLEVHMMGLHSTLLSEQRTGTPPVPAYSAP